jgi:alpha-L-rhamnosidase
MYGGEDYDARLDPGDWTAAGFDDSTWDDALIAAFPEGAPTITPAEHDPVRVVETFAVSWQQLGPRSWVADLGSVIAGWCRYELLTDDPITITATHGERLRADGSVDNDNEHVTGAMQVDHLRPIMIIDDSARGSATRDSATSRSTGSTTSPGTWS